MPALTPLPAPPLWREVGLLAVVAGIVALNHPYAAATSLVLIVWVDSRARGARLVLLALCFCMGLALGWSARPQALPQFAPSWCTGYVRIEGTVAEIRALPDARMRVLLEKVRPLDGSAPALPGRVAWTWDAPRFSSQGDTLLPGQRIHATLRIRPVRGFANADSANFSAYWQRQGVAWTTWARGDRPQLAVYGEPAVPSAWRHALRERLDRLLWMPAAFSSSSSTTSSISSSVSPASSSTSSAFSSTSATSNSSFSLFSVFSLFSASASSFASLSSPEGSAPASAARAASVSQPAAKAVGAFGRGTALIPALLFADQSALSPVDLDRVTRAGLRHSLALSGQHLAVVGLLAFIPACILVRVWSGLLLLLPWRGLVGLLSLPFAAVCLWLGNAPPSLIRAALMLALWVLLFRQGGMRTLFDGLCLALACIIAADPACVSEIGVQLSFLAVAGMAAIGPLLNRLVAPAKDLCFFDPPCSTSGSTGGLSGDTHPASSPLLPSCALAALYSRVLRRSPPAFVRTPACWLRWLVWGLGLSGAAWLATLPLATLYFGRAPSGLVYNLLWLPVLGCVVLPAAWAGLLLSAIGWDSAARIALHVAALPGTFLFEGLELLDRAELLHPGLSLRPHWTAILGYAALVASLVALSSRRGGNQGNQCCQANQTNQTSQANQTSRAAIRLAIAGVLLSLCAVGLRLWTPDGVWLRVLDVGQGQAVLVSWPGGRALIDSGGFASSRLDSGRDIIAPILTANRPPLLHTLFASHMDRDHVGGMPFLLDTFTVGSLRIGPLAPDFSESIGTSDSNDFSGINRANRANRISRSSGTSALERCLRAYNPVTMVSGDRVKLAPDLFLEAVWPPATHSLRGNDSLVLRLVYKGQGLALLPGDLEPREQRALTRLHPPEALRAAVLVVPHHGSRRNLETALYTAVQPVLAVASAGLWNQWDLPSEEVRTALAAHSIPLLETGKHGGIDIRLHTDNGLEIHEQVSKTMRRLPEL